MAIMAALTPYLRFVKRRWIRQVDAVN